jgi:hypothetical protein
MKKEIVGLFSNNENDKRLTNFSNSLEYRNK